jgi:hypothetical protein
LGETTRMSRSRLNWNQLSIVEGLGFILVIYLPLVALCVLAGVQVFRTMLLNAHWVAVTVFFGPLLLPPILYAARLRSSFTAAVSVLIPLELLAAFLAQYTLIGLSSLLVLLLLWANLIPVSLHFSTRGSARMASWVLLGLIAVSSLLPQVRLGATLLKLDSEAKRIVAYSYEDKIRNGTFPADLSDYSWRYPNLSGHFAYYGHGADDKFTYPFKDGPHYDHSEKFSFRYFVGDRGTAYWYSSKKGWYVEDD